MASELSASVAKAIDLTAKVADDDIPWNSPLQDSQAGSELVEEEARNPEPGKGSWPWLQAPMIARGALWAGVEEAKALQGALDVENTSYAADVLCRSILESLSLAWWLLESEIAAPDRVARLFLFRWYTSRQTEQAVKSLGLRADEYEAEYGELPNAVKAHATELGISLEERSVDGRKRICCGDQIWPSYTDRIAQLVENIWPQGRMPYAVLSAVAHAELLGFTRNVGQAQRGTVPSLRPTPDRTGHWLWYDAYLAAGALLFAAERAAGFLGLTEHVIAAQAAKAETQSQLRGLRPAPPTDG
jgi:hypothetical protein